MGDVLYRLVRFDDTYLGGFADDGHPWWGPKDEAHPYGHRHTAHDALRAARLWVGKSADLAVVRVVRATEPGGTDHG